MAQEYTFTRGFSADYDGDRVDATVHMLLELVSNGRFVKSFDAAIDIELDVSEFDGQQIGDEDEDGYHTFYEFNQITGTISDITLDNKIALNIISYCTDRNLIFSIPDDEEDYCPAFINEFNNKPVTIELLTSYCNYLNSGEIELTDTEQLYLDVANTNPRKYFSDTPYGDLSNQTTTNIDVSGYGLTSLKGSPKVVEGVFDIRGNKLDSLKFGPKEVNILMLNGVSDFEFLPHIKNLSKSRVVSYADELLREELKYRLKHNNTYGISSQEIRLKIFEETGDERFLPDNAKDVFLF